MITTYLAPMCEVTDYAFRQLCRNYARVVTCTDMISARALEQRLELPRLLPGDGVQLVSDSPESLAFASQAITDAAFLDLNAGCPVHKVVRGGAGAGLLKTPWQLRECVEAMRAATDLPISVKIRVGWSKNTLPDTAAALAGLDLARVIVHGRTVLQAYSGVADWAAIKQAVELFDCPVIGNGDVVSYESAKRMVEETGCDGVMIGRAAMHNPRIFEAVEKAEDFELSAEARYALIKEYLSLATDTDFFIVRNHALWFCHGTKGAARVREELNHVHSVDELQRVVTRHLVEI